MCKEINWLHLSDLHFGYEDNSVSRMRNELPDYLKQNFNNINYIFITGDIIHGKANHEKAYDEAAEYIMNIAKNA